MNDRFKISGGGGGVIRWKNDQFIIEGSFKGLIIAIDASCALISSFPVFFNWNWIDVVDEYSFRFF